MDIISYKTIHFVLHLLAYNDVNYSSIIKDETTLMFIEKEKMKAKLKNI